MQERSRIKNRKLLFSLAGVALVAATGVSAAVASASLGPKSR